MKFIDLFEFHLREEGLTVAVCAQKNYITFSKLPPPRQRYYRLSLIGKDLKLSEVNLNVSDDKQSSFYVPHKRILLSVNIHDPKGTEAILDWIKEYRSKLN